MTIGEHLLALASGRHIRYHVFGDPAGMPVLNCHGGLASGRDIEPATRNATELGLCIVSPDRPGVGGTDRLPGHRMAPWVHSDVVPLLEHLDIAEFGVLGWSAGGQYALAVGHELKERVNRCAVVAGCPPLDDPSISSRLNRMDRTLTLLSRRVPFLARTSFRVTRLMSSVAPHLLLRISTRGISKAESAAVREQGPWLSDILGEGVRQPRGEVDEYLTMCAPWGFDPEEVAVPVRIFQGDADTLVPAAWGQVLADRIPGAELTVYPGGGHFICLTQSREILTYLAQSAR
jgi:pimeloyl-ACP methyl ester carboxylesterase